MTIRWYPCLSCFSGIKQFGRPETKQQIFTEPRFVLSEELLKRRLVMSGQEVHPGNCDRFMVQMRHVVVRGESLHARTDLPQCFFKGLTVQVNPRQPQVVGMPELRIIQARQV